MMTYRFTERRQKDVQLAVARDLLVDHQDDQPAKTVLSNAIAVLEATLVAGELDEWIAKSNRWYQRSTLGLSVFFVALAVFEFGFAYVEWREGGLIRALGPIFFGVALLVYCFALRGMWRIQRGYHEVLKRLENLQLELPPVPTSKAN